MQQSANFILCGFVDNLRFCAEMQWSVEYCNQKKITVRNLAALCGRIGRIVAKADSADRRMLRICRSAAKQLDTVLDRCASVCNDHIIRKMLKKYKTELVVREGKYNKAAFSTLNSSSSS